jgi:hypothetical protein
MRTELIRSVRLHPYRVGLGPSFRLYLYDTDRPSGRYAMRNLLAYELRQHEHGKTTVLFSGEDFSPSCMHADDSDETIAALLGFLTLRPGDTDSEYFEHYTDEQRQFCAQHAETLACEAIACFGED